MCKYTPLTLFFYLYWKALFLNLKTFLWLTLKENICLLTNRKTVVLHGSRNSIIFQFEQLLSPWPNLAILFECTHRIGPNKKMWFSSVPRKTFMTYTEATPMWLHESAEQKLNFQWVWWIQQANRTCRFLIIQVPFVSLTLGKLFSFPIFHLLCKMNLTRPNHHIVFCRPPWNCSCISEGRI